MLDAGTLRPVISDYTEPSVCFPGATNRIVDVRYFSHTWHDGDWYGNVMVVIPEVIRQEGVVTMADTGADIIEPGMDMNKEFLDCMANQFGIAAATTPSSDRHFGLSEIHDVYDHILCEMTDRNDLAWSPYWPFIALRMRALTMIGDILDQPVHSAYHFGASITASLSYPFALHDDRVKGLAATGAYGNGAMMSAQPRKPGLYDRWCQAGCNPYAMPPDLFTALLESADLHEIGPALDMPILQIVPTNDSNAPPLITRERFAPIEGDLHLAAVPNWVHSHGSFRHAELFRMWIDHLEFNRPVNRIESTTLTLQGSDVTVSARITEAAPIESASFFYITMDDDTYLGSEAWWSTPSENYEAAVWQELPLQKAGDTWQATLPAPPTNYLAGFVDSSDLHGDTPGYASGYPELLTLSPQAETELCAAIAADCKLDNEKCIRFLERCLEGCNDAFGRCIAGHAKATCDEAKAAMCKDAVDNCLDAPCRDSYTQCAQSGFTSCDQFYSDCLEPCEFALFDWIFDQNTASRDQVLDGCGL
jgi:hypothetical protein